MEKLIYNRFKQFALKRCVNLILSLFVNSFPVFSQSQHKTLQKETAVSDLRPLIHLGDRTFTDTAWSSPYNPDSVFVYYYSLGSKYPESSETIRQRAIEFILGSGQHFGGSGYISFRFFIDSAGRMSKRVEVFETDQYYKKYDFQDKFVMTLYNFLTTLREWKRADIPLGYPPFYIGIMSFKIYEGDIVNIIP